MSGHQKHRTNKIDWRASLKSHREGIYYFTALTNVILACPSEYFEHRCITTESKERIIHEWKEWTIEFSKSEIQVLRDISAKNHNIDDDAQSVIAKRIVKNHKVNLLQVSSEQVHHISKELTTMICNAPAPLSTEPPDKSLSPQAGQKHPRDPRSELDGILLKTPRNSFLSPTVVPTENIDSPHTIQSGNTFFLDNNTDELDDDQLDVAEEDESNGQDFLLPDKVEREFNFVGNLDGLDLATGFEPFFTEVKKKAV
ncbi:hypothetical protein BGZ46_005208, partial [Entomortierella lignicola]